MMHKQHDNALFGSCGKTKEYHLYHSDTSTGFLEMETYEKSHLAIRKLKESLHKEQVANLAREVLHRIASHDFTLSYPTAEPTDAELETLCMALVSNHNNAAAEIIDTVQKDGASAEAVYLNYLAPAARMLGVWWSDDRLSFTQVTIGSARMFAIMRSMKHLFASKHQPNGKFAIFASVPGEDHTLGIRMATDLFREDGWGIALKLDLSHDDLVAEIVKTPCDIIGLSMSGRHSFDALSKLVVALHICCPQTPIIVGGQDIDDVEPLLSLLGVDGIYGDIEDAKEQMSVMLDYKMAG